MDDHKYKTQLCTGWKENFLSWKGLVTDAFKLMFNLDLAEGDEILLKLPWNEWPTPFSSDQVEKLQRFLIHKEPLAVFSPNEVFKTSRQGIETTHLNLFEFIEWLARTFNAPNRPNPTKVCKYGGKCRFAHGSIELREYETEKNFKVVRCKKGANCPYMVNGNNCRFYHDEDDVFLAEHPNYRKVLPTGSHETSPSKKKIPRETVTYSAAKKRTSLPSPEYPNTDTSTDRRDIDEDDLEIEAPDWLDSLLDDGHQVKYHTERLYQLCQ